MKKVLSIITLFVLLNFNTVAQVDINSMYQQANQMLQSGNINQAGLQKMYDSFSKGYEQDVENNKKKNAEIWLSNGIEKSKKNLELNAIEDFNISINYYPTSGAYNRKGCSEYALGEYAGALESFKKALELAPDNQTIKENKSSALLQLSKVESAPISIYDIKIANVDNDGNIISDYGSSIFSESTYYLKPNIYYKSNIKGNISLKLKFYTSDGSLRVGDTSPTGFSTKDEIKIDGNGLRKLSGWGSKTKGNWSSGKCRIEIWYNDVCLRTTNFYILSEAQGLNANSSMPVYQPIQNNSNSGNTALKKRKCTYCNGSGISPGWSTIPGYGSSELHWCDVCKQNVSASHGGHPICPICNGKKYIESY